VLCVATIWLRARSYRVTDYVFWDEPFGASASTFNVSLGNGLVSCGSYWLDHTHLNRIDGKPLRTPGQTFILRHNKPRAPTGYELFYGDGVSPNALGFGFARKPRWSTRSPPYIHFGHWAAIAPLWSFSVAFAIMPALWVRNRVQKGFKRSGHCVKCGYDLRATPDRCPECGTIPTKVKA
jgi:hypothetical protein